MPKLRALQYVERFLKCIEMTEKQPRLTLNLAESYNLLLDV